MGIVSIQTQEKHHEYIYHLSDTVLTVIAYSFDCTNYIHYKIPVTQRDFHLFYQVFRHGDHTPLEFFPTDKHKEVARQQGYGQLTKVRLLTWANIGRWSVDICFLELCFLLEKAHIKLLYTDLQKDSQRTYQEATATSSH